MRPTLSNNRDDLPSLSIRRPVLVLVVNLLIVLAGLAALFAIEVRELPDVDRPVVTLRVDFPGASPETMDAEVISLLEGAVAHAACESCATAGRCRRWGTNSRPRGRPRSR